MTEERRSGGVCIVPFVQGIGMHMDSRWPVRSSRPLVAALSSPATFAFAPSMCALRGAILSQRSTFLGNEGRLHNAVCAKSRKYIAMTVSEDPVTRRVREELAADGVSLDELLNAGKVVNLTRKLDKLSLESFELAEGSDELREAQQQMSKIESELVREKRQVMQTWLKRLFLLQAVFFIGIGGILSNNAVPGGVSVPLVGQALGFWAIWLFTIPALRARKGTSKTEKSALNVAFVATPLLNVALPSLTRNCGVIWAADVVLLATCYLFYGIKAVNAAESHEGSNVVGKEEGRIKGVLKYLDWGSWR